MQVISFLNMIVLPGGDCGMAVKHNGFAEAKSKWAGQGHSGFSNNYLICVITPTPLMSNNMYGKCVYSIV